MNNKTSEIDNLLEKGKNYSPKKFEIDARYCLWLVMEDIIRKYLKANTHKSETAHTKGHFHILMIKTILACIFKIEYIEDAFNHDEACDIWEAMHRKTQDLTDHLDKEVGFPTRDENPDISKYALLFFEKFVDLALNAK